MTKTANRMLIIALCVLVAVIACVTFASHDTINAYASDTPSVVVPTFEVLDGVNPSDNAREGYSNLFDGNTETKYCIQIEKNPYVVIKSSHTDTKIVGYTFYTGNDTASHEGRNPASWTLYGCNDYDDSTKTGTWTELHKVENDATMGATNQTGYDFDFEPKYVFRYFKFEFTARRGASNDVQAEYTDTNIQLSEIEITTESNPTTYDTKAAFYAVGGSENWAIYTDKLTNDTIVSYTTMTCPGEVVIKSSMANTVVSGYKFFTPCSSSDRRYKTPKSWVLYGSNVNSNWTEIHQVTNYSNYPYGDDWTVFSIPDNATSYVYYKFEFTDSNSDGTKQIVISEIEMIQGRGDIVSDTNPPTSETYSAFTALDGTAPYENRETYSYRNLFTNDYGKNEKNFYTMGNFSDPRYVIFKSNSFGTKISKYTILTFQSYQFSWKFYGCNDHDESIKGDINNGSWQLIDSRDNISPISYAYPRNEGDTYTVENPAPYKYYKFEFLPVYDKNNTAGRLIVSRLIFEKDERPVVDNSQQTIKNSKVSVNIGDNTWFDNDLTTGTLVNYGLTWNFDVTLKGNGAIVYGATYHFADAPTPQYPSNISALFDNTTLKLATPSGTTKTFSHIKTIVSEDFKDYTVLFDVGNDYVNSGNVKYTIEFASTVSEKLNLAEIDLLHTYACEHSFTGSFKQATEGDCLNYGYKTYRLCDFNCGACQYYGTDNALYVCEAHQYETKVANVQEHSWGEEHGAAAGDCGHDGNYAYSQCTVCDAYKYVNKGVSFICTQSEFDTKVKISATGNHTQKTGTFHKAADPECIYSGNYEYYECSICGYYVYTKDGETLLGRYADTQIAPTGNHIWSTEQIIDKVPATCTSTGTKAHWHCNQCNKDYDNDKSTVLTSLTIEKLAHNYGDWITAVTPTCTATGNYAYRQCSDCGEYQYIQDLTVTDYNAYVSAESHPELKTCTSTEFDTNIKLAVANHNFGSWVAFKDYTCTEDGNHWYRKCSNCDLYEYFICISSTIDPEEYLAEHPKDLETTTDFSVIKSGLTAHHNWSDTQLASAKDATCTEDGNHEYVRCSVCNGYQYIIDETTYFCAENEFNTKVVIPKHHTWGNVVKGHEATCVATGKPAYRQCTVSGCGACQYASLKYDVDANYFDTATEGVYVVANVNDVTTYNKLDHDFVNVESSKTPSCTEYGNYSYYKCDRGCNQYMYYVGSEKCYCDATEEDYNTYIRRDKAPHTYATTCQKKCSNCPYERDESERVHKYDTTSNASHYNNNTQQHAYFCQNDNCSDGIYYEDHSFASTCSKQCSKCPYERDESELIHDYSTLTFGKIDGTQYHWYKCSNAGCTGEDTSHKVACVIKYENVNADKHVSYCEVAGERHELGESGAQKLTDHEWTLNCVFNQAKCNAGEGNFHAKKCTECGVFAQDEEACNVVYYTQDDTDHWQICSTCQHKLSDDEAHDNVMVYDGEDHWFECSVCGRIEGDYIAHTFESATSTSCSEEGCGYQRFLKANISSINGYAIDASVGGLTSSGKTDRTDTNLTLTKYALFDSNFSQIDFVGNSTDANMTFRPGTTYYAIFYYNCGKVYPSNDMKSSDFTLPQGYVFGYYDYQVDDDTNDVILEVLVTLPILGGVSQDVSVSGLSIDFKNFEVGKLFGNVVIDITCKDLPEVKFNHSIEYSSDTNGTEITDTTVIDNLAYSIFMIVTAPDGFNFYGLTESGITVKNDMGIAYIFPTEDGKISRDGKTITLIAVINSLVPEHVCGAEGWEILESSYDYLCPDKTTQHTRMCKTCGEIEFIPHVYDNDEDTTCDDCGYIRTLKLDEMRFTLTGYQSDALLNDITVTYSGSKYASIISIWLGAIFDLQESNIQSSNKATFVPGEVYGLMVYMVSSKAIDVTDCLFDNVYVNNTKVDVIIAEGDEDGVIYAVRLPAVTGESTQTKLGAGELKTSGFVVGSALNDVSFSINNPGIEKISTAVVLNDSAISETEPFSLGDTYMLTVEYTLKNGYYGLGVTADDMKVSLYDDIAADSPTKIADFECVYIMIDDIGDPKGNRAVLCMYLVQLVVPEGTEGHGDAHVFPTENPTYHTDENKHYVLCGCGAYDEGQAHVYGEDFEHLLTCSVCGYQRVYSIEKVEITTDLHVGNDQYGIRHGAELHFDGIHADDSFTYNGSLVFYISQIKLFEGTLTDLNAMYSHSPSSIMLVDTAYTLAVTLECYNDYFDVGALEASDYSLNGFGETAITCSYAHNIDMSDTLTVLYFHIPATQSKHIHGGVWIDEVPANCTDAGTKGHYVCTVCGDNFDENNVKIDDLTINALGHDYDITYTWNADYSVCTASGVCKHDSSHTISGTSTVTSVITQHQSCLLDELTTYTATFTNPEFTAQTKADIKTANALGHDQKGSVAHKDADCTNNGVVGGTYCSRCNHGKEAAEATINALGHNQDGSVAHVDAKCTETGVVGGTYCTRCNHGKEAAEATIKALGHAWSTDEIIVEEAANCTETGIKAHWHCNSCNKDFESDKTTEIGELTIAAKGHNYGDWIAEVPATVESEGTKAHKDCTACGKHFDNDGNEITDLTIPKLAPTDPTTPDTPITPDDPTTPSDPTDPTTPSDGQKDGLSGGAIAGIAIGSVAVAGLGGFAIFWFVIKKKKWADLVAVFKNLFAKK